LSNRFLHIVSFTIPDPPDYGGVIDVYYKIKALSQSGTKVILHCYQYGDREATERLAAMCFEVHYYQRSTQWRKAIGTTPYIMASRSNLELVEKLKNDNYPILLEGMHTAILADHPALKNRHIAIRMHNIEWEYYKHLASATSDLTKKLFFYIESMRLRKAATILNRVNKIFTISPFEHQKLSNKYPNCTYLPVFHGNQKVNIKEGVGKYILYHGNITVPENQSVVKYILKTFSSKNNFNLPIIIAGKGSIMDLEQFNQKQFKNISFVLNPTASEMQELITNAQIHLLFTFQKTGIKLKLINSLFNGRHAIANNYMVEGTGLESLCTVVDLNQNYTSEILKLYNEPISTDSLQRHKILLENNFSNAKGAETINEWIDLAPSTPSHSHI
jgi:hypothetical protein